MMNLIPSIRLTIVTLLITVGAYTGMILGFAKAVVPERALGSLIVNSEGKVVGSSLVAQKFTQPGYFWPRPSAVDYNASGAGGSNKSPTSADLTDRAVKIVADFGATQEKPLPAELAAASGAGLDPHITEQGALFQVDRVAKARNISSVEVESLIRKISFSPGGPFTPDRLVNVLELNLALESRGK